LEKQPDARPTLQQVSEVLDNSAPASTAQTASTAWPAKLDARLRELGPLLERPLRVGSFELPASVLALVAFGSLVTGILLVVLVSSLTGDESPKAAEKAKPELRPEPGVPPSPPPKPAASTRSEVTRIEELPVYKRNFDDWLALARGTAALGRYKDSALAYQAVLSLKGSMREDRRLRADLRRAAPHPQSFKLAVNLCANRLGKAGIDILWDLWLELQGKPGRQEDAEFLKRRLRVLSRRASPELRTAIELATTENCDKLARSVARAQTQSDRRAVPVLQQLLQTRGCGDGQQQDCFPCLRQGGALERALAHAESQAPPELY
jgi:hypothetical protein